MTRREAAALATAAALLLVVHLWGRHLVASGHHLLLGWPPFFGRAEPRGGLRIVPALVIGGGLVMAWPRLSGRLSWRPLLLVTAVSAAAWAVALALVDGFSGLTAPLRPRFEFLAGVGAVDLAGGPGPYLRTFTARLLSYPIQVQGHPPGIVLALWGLARIGLGGAGPAAAVAAVMQLSLNVLVIGNFAYLFEYPVEWVPLLVLALVPAGREWGFDRRLAEAHAGRWPF